jgi:hypothetical protein
VSGSENSLHLFLNGFTTRDLAEPLASFDETAPWTTIRAAMEAQHLEVVGIRRAGLMAGWLTLEDAANDREPNCCRTFDADSVIVDTASLNEVVQGLNVFSCLFVQSLGQVSGHICRTDLQKPAMRMWLFGLVTTTELRITRIIDEFCPQESWRQYLSEGRLQMAVELQEERRRRHQNPSLLDCLQFADKGRIVARDERLRNYTRFSSRRAVEDFVRALQDLRNNLAHSQDISGDWNVIFDLASNLHRVVLGPAFQTESPVVPPT